MNEERPIVERPTSLIGEIIRMTKSSALWRQKDVMLLVKHIEHIEAIRDGLANEVHQAQVIIEGLTAERDQAESKAKDFELIIRSHHTDGY